MAQKADVVIYAISTNISRIENDGDKVLKYLALETGGQAFFPVQGAGSGAVFREHRQRAAAAVQHLLPPRAAQGRWAVSLDGVKVNGRKDLVVRARKGYYAPKF